jgi:hypothetical protein
MTDTLLQKVQSALRVEEMKAQRWRAGHSRGTHYFKPDIRAADRKAECQVAGLVKWLADKAQELSP